MSFLNASKHHENVTDLLHRNTVYSQTHAAPPSFSQALADPSPVPKTCIITCADPRVIPERFFNLGVGDALVLRNAGGRARSEDVLRSLVVFEQALPGGLGTVMVVQHEDCGLTHASDESVRKGAEEALKAKGQEARKEELPHGFGEIKGVESAVKEDVKWLRGLPFWKEGMQVRGFVWKMLGDGKVIEVEC